MNDLDFINSLCKKGKANGVYIIEQNGKILGTAKNELNGILYSLGALLYGGHYVGRSGNDGEQVGNSNYNSSTDDFLVEFGGANNDEQYNYMSVNTSAHGTHTNIYDSSTSTSGYSVTYDATNNAVIVECIYTPFDSSATSLDTITNINCGIIGDPSGSPLYFHFTNSDTNISYDPTASFTAKYVLSFKS